MGAIFTAVEGLRGVTGQASSYWSMLTGLMEPVRKTQKSGKLEEGVITGMGVLVIVRLIVCGCQYEELDIMVSRSYPGRDEGAGSRR